MACSGQIEAISIHHLAPRSDEVADKLLAIVILVDAKTVMFFPVFPGRVLNRAGLVLLVHVVSSGPFERPGILAVKLLQQQH